MSGGFGGGVHAVLGDFVEAAGGRLDLVAIKMVEWDATFADRVALLDGFGYVGLGESGGLEQRTSCAQVSGERTGESAAGTVQEFFLTFVSGEGHDLITIEEDVD